MRDEGVMSDLLALALSGLWVILVVSVAELLRRGGRLSFPHSRKVIHVGIGTWILPTTLLFHSPVWAAMGPAAFVLLNLLSRRRRLIRAMEEETGENLGTVLFPISFLLLILGLWRFDGGRLAAAAGILSLAWGDAAAALVGRRFGRHRYTVGSSWRSIEGSLAMFVVTAIAIWAAAAVLEQPFYPVPLLLATSLLATLLEAFARRGFDNLLVPVGTALFLWSLGGHLS